MDTSRVFNLKNILFGLGIFATVVAVLGFSGRLPGFTNKNSTANQLSGTVTIWGTLPKENVQPTLDLFNKNIAKTYSVVYQEVAEEDLVSTLIQNLADGSSPDLILAPYSYILQNEKRLTVIPNTVISEIDYKKTFVDESALLLTKGGYLGLPVSIDPLILFFNRDLLSSAGFGNPPTTWDQLFDYASRITKVNQDKSLKVSTIPFGTYRNIPHITDLVLALVMQLGSLEPVSKSFGKDTSGNLIPKYKVNLNNDPTNPESGAGPLNLILAFMKNFSDSQKETFNWHNNMPNALTNFLAGSQAFYIGYASEAGYIKNANQKLYFDYTYLPQAAGRNIATTYGRMYTLALLKSAPNSAAAYSTMLSLVTGSYSANLAGATGGVSALKSVLAAPTGDQASIIFNRSALFAKGFQDLHRDQLESLMQESIENVYTGFRSTVEAAKDLSKSLQDIYDRN